MYSVFRSLKRPSESTFIEMPFSTKRATFHWSSAEIEHRDLLPTSPFIPTLTWCTQCYEAQSRVESFWLLWQHCFKLPGRIFPFHTESVLALLFDCTLDKMWTTCRRSPWGEEKAGLKESADWCPSSPPSPEPSSLALFLLIIWNPY